MSFELQTIVPWGRSLEEYEAMFALSAQDLGGRILGCGDGPASFNAELSDRGGCVVSLDPIYAFEAGSIRTRVQETAETVLAQTSANREAFVWDFISDLDDLRRRRLAAMETFLEDFELGKAQGRYITGELPSLPFADASFDLALCSHFLFLYSDHLDANFHLASLRELLRVARQVRIFPLLNLDRSRSRHLEEVCAELRALGFQVKEQRVDYEFQKGGNTMLEVSHG